MYLVRIDIYIYITALVSIAQYNRPEYSSPSLALFAFDSLPAANPRTYQAHFNLNSLIYVPTQRKAQSFWLIKAMCGIFSYRTYRS